MKAQAFRRPGGPKGPLTFPPLRGIISDDDFSTCASLPCTLCGIPPDAGDGDMSSAVMGAMVYEGRKAGRVIRVNRTKTSGGYGMETGTEK